VVLSLTVVICAYTLDRWSDLQQAVRSVQAQAVPPLQVVVVIDHDGELLALAAKTLTSCLVVANAGPRGLSGGRNTGVAASTGDVVAFLDDDAVVEPSWAQELLAAYTDDGVVGVGGSVLPEWRAPRPDWFPDEFLWVVGCSYRGQPANRAAVRNAIGANMSFRRDVLEQIGGFHPGIGRVGGDAAGCEETELSVRAGKVRPGARILLEPAAVAHHAVTPQRVTRAYFRQRCRAEGRSKAVVCDLTGAQQALASERTYTSRTLPSGVLLGLGQALRGDPAGARRAWAMCEGFALTVSSYLLARRGLRRPASGG
jgi:glycosyltransferase involved in cell wall biosynthesis